MHYFVQAANLFVLLSLLILGENLIKFSPSSVDSIPRLGLGIVCTILMVFQTVYLNFGAIWVMSKSCHTCYSVLLYHDQCRYFV